MQVGKLGLKLDMIVGRAGDIACAAGTGAHFLDRLVHGVPDDGALAHTEVVVGAPDRDVDHLIPAEVIGRGVGPAASLQIGEDAIAALGMQRLQMLAETELVIHSILDHLN